MLAHVVWDWDTILVHVVWDWDTILFHVVRLRYNGSPYSLRLRHNAGPCSLRFILNAGPCSLRLWHNAGPYSLRLRQCWLLIWECDTILARIVWDWDTMLVPPLLSSWDLIYIKVNVVQGVAWKDRFNCNCTRLTTQCICSVFSTCHNSVDPQSTMWEVYNTQFDLTRHNISSHCSIFPGGSMDPSRFANTTCHTFQLVLPAVSQG